MSESANKTFYRVIFNPTANRAKARRLYGPTVQAARELGIEAEFVASPSPEEVPRLALEAWMQGKVPVAMGGDGTVNMVASGLLVGEGARYSARTGKTPVMGIIECGSGNDTAASMGLPVKDPLGSLAVLKKGRRRAIDALLVECDSGEKGISLAVIAAGFDSEVTETAERIRVIKGPVRYTVAVFTTLVRSEPAEFELSLDDREAERFEAWLVAVANGPRYGGGMRIAPDASLTDGMADICIVGPVTRRHFVRTFPKVFSGNHIHDPQIRLLRGSRLRLDASRKFTCYGDGERIGPLPASVEVSPKAIEIMSPDEPKDRGGEDGSA